MEHCTLKCKEIIALGMTEYKLLQLAGSAVQHSKKEICASVVRRCAFHTLPLLDALPLALHSGGRGAMVQGKLVMLGTVHFMREKHIDVQYAIGFVRILISRGYIARIITVDGKLAGVLGFK